MLSRVCSADDGRCFSGISGNGERVRHALSGAETGRPDGRRRRRLNRTLMTGGQNGLDLKLGPDPLTISHR